MMHQIATLIGATAILLLVAGCGDSQSSTSSQHTTKSIPTLGRQADLDNVALCFHEAVTLLQAAPNTPDDIAVFLKDAKAVVDTLARDSSDAVFGALRWKSDGTLLISSYGDPILCRVANQTHDNYGPDGSDWVAEYEFYIPSSGLTSRTTIQLAMGD